ncbi:hypothetical protein [Adonisia turfae]
MLPEQYIDEMHKGIEGFTQEGGVSGAAKGGAIGATAGIIGAIAAAGAAGCAPFVFLPALFGAIGAVHGSQKKGSQKKD